MKGGADLIDVAGGTPVLGEAMVSAREMLEMGELLRGSEPEIPFALGGVTDGIEAEECLAASGATLVSVGRALLANPNWAWAAASELGVAR
jgi:NADPH2 dehydrogenase